MGSIKLYKFSLTPVTRNVSLSKKRCYDITWNMSTLNCNNFFTLVIIRNFWKLFSGRIFFFFLSINLINVINIQPSEGRGRTFMTDSITYCYCCCCCAFFFLAVSLINAIVCIVWIKIVEYNFKDKRIEFISATQTLDHLRNLHLSFYEFKVDLKKLLRSYVLLIAYLHWVIVKLVSVSWVHGPSEGLVMMEWERGREEERKRGRDWQTPAARQSQNKSLHRSVATYNKCHYVDSSEMPRSPLLFVFTFLVSLMVLSLLPLPAASISLSFSDCGKYCSQQHRHLKQKELGPWAQDRTSSWMNAWANK